MQVFFDKFLALNIKQLYKNLHEFASRFVVGNLRKFHVKVSRACARGIRVLPPITSVL